MPMRICSGCRATVDMATARKYKGRCVECGRKRERDRSRDRRSAARERELFYKRKKWEATARHKLFNDPLCELKHPCCLGIASEVHHQTPLQDGGEPYAMENPISACKPCHSAETRREQQGRS